MVARMDEVLVEKNGPVATVTLNRPEVKNAVTGEGWSELLRVFTELGFDDDVRCVVVTGAGTDFCAGADVRQRQIRIAKRLCQLSFPTSASTQVDPKLAATLQPKTT